MIGNVAAVEKACEQILFSGEKNSDFLIRPKIKDLEPGHAI